MGILKSIARIFTWWDGQTLGTQLHTWRKGVKVGEDDQGNIYYTSKDGKRRWVIYNGDIEASRISADWHGWLHHTYSNRPDDAPLAHKAWEKPHQKNLTGSDAAYAPAGSIRKPQASDQRDYEAWQPE